MFDYRHKGAADQMRTFWEKLIEYVGTNYRHDISKELQNKAIVTIPEPTYSDEIKEWHQLQAAVVCTA